MGNSTSKAARRLPKRTEPPSWAGSGSQSSGAVPKRPIAREQKDQAIEDDARDPQFMNNLSRLGVVNVDHHMKAFQPHQKSREIIESQKQSEQEAISMQPSRNRVQASTLSFLLDKSKSASTRQEMIELADQYGVDIEILEKISQYVTSPSIKSDSVVRNVRNEDGEEELSVMAIWVQSRAFKT
ncbi:hypothetical protein BDP27DRAFT_67856 [Rhodocollybia butyracea]|uniref:Uncharacterized protein n=1 Tax=Rhodocollybia butyracea TaxID=206335 RepID=A0A9P5U475_9AGAR|nr:hypothetical protein BDP27DRAFT_67856 [Rhodocollybia butyracea]